VIKEHSCQLAERGRLNGIVTTPKNDKPKSNVALVLVTAGFTPKTGPFRLYTLISRSAAKLGMVAMRFDLGGIGNSEQLNPGIPLSLRTEKDIKHALNYITETYGINKFILGGLCSGAEDSFRFARDHDEVVGVFLMDGHAYRTSGWWLQFLFSRKVLNRIGRFVFNSIGLLQYVQRTGQSSLEGDQSGLVDYQQMDIKESTSTLKTLLARGVKLLYIYTGSMGDKINSASQFYAMYPEIKQKNLITIRHLPHMGHVQVFEEDRKEISSTISQWFGAQF
jgi:hypothetical protein